MAKSTDVKQIGELLDAHAATLQLYATSWTTSPEDCVQEAFVELAAQSNFPDTPVAWLYRVVKNRAINSTRAEQRRSQREETAVRLKQDSSRQRVGDGLLQEDTIELTEALKSLEPEDHELVVLRIWSGLTWSQIAELSNQPSSTAQRRYVGALKKLKNKLEPECLNSISLQKR